jgi:uncharacterized protein (DUF1800 family)
MNYSLNAYASNLTASQAAHLLRRATFGPSQSNITAFTGVSATTAIQTLIDNIALNPTPAPVDLDSSKATAGQPYVNTSYDDTRNFDFRYYYKYWWTNIMATQSNNPSILDKLTLFWQNHFVTTEEVVDEYRVIHQYFMLIRNSILGNFKEFVRDVSKNPAMLKYLNGNENVKGKPNENYARELQELFVVGVKDFLGNNNYTEDDVKAAARVLTGWSYTGYKPLVPTAVSTIFTPSKHDGLNKQFSTKYLDPNTSLGTVITGQGSVSVLAGDVELDDFLTMLFRHPETPKFICRKLYRFFVNPNVTQDIETNVIIPLANLFKSIDPVTNKAFEIKPIILKLLASEHFYDVGNVGAIIKSPAEYIFGTLKFFNFQAPIIDSNNLTNSLKNYKAHADFIHNGVYKNYSGLANMQMPLLDQPSVFGYEAYYSTGYSRNWINSTQVGLRNSFTDTILNGQTLVSGITPLITLKIDMLAMVDTANVNHNPTIPLPPNYDVTNCVHIVDLVTMNLFATELSTNQKTFLIDTILMGSTPRTNWTTQWASYKSNPTTNNINSVKSKLDALIKYLLRMAEYNIC